MVESTPVLADAADMRSLALLENNSGINCMPSPESIYQVQNSDLVLVSGQFLGAGKSTFIQVLEAQGRTNIPSWTNRELRPGEVEGIDKIQGSLSLMAQKALEGYFLELEPVRPGIFYATPAEFAPGKAYVKDLELKGALRLRTFAPELPIVVPLPPLDFVDAKQVTEWERRVGSREGLHKSITGNAAVDLKNRLTGVVEEATRILDLELVDDPRTLFVVNDNLPEALQRTHLFLASGGKVKQDKHVAKHVEQLRELALIALEAA